MSDAALANQDEARTPTGEIKDQTPAKTQDQQAKPGTESQTTATTKETQPPAEPSKEGSLLTKDEGEKKSESTGAPDKYEFKVPDGFVITDDANKELSTMFKEMNLPQAQAQRLIDYVAPQILEAIEAPFKQYQETRQGWQKEITDKYGSKLPEVKATIGRALDGLGNPALVASFKEAMDHTGAGDNPAVWDALYELSKLVSEGTHVKGGGPSKHGQTASGIARPPSAAKAMYPNLPSASD